jgi:hypothetical protein
MSLACLASFVCNPTEAPLSAIANSATLLTRLRCIVHNSGILGSARSKFSVYFHPFALSSAGLASVWPNRKPGSHHVLSSRLPTARSRRAERLLRTDTPPIAGVRGRGALQAQVSEREIHTEGRDRTFSESHARAAQALWATSSIPHTFFVDWCFTSRKANFV